MKMIRHFIFQSKVVLDQNLVVIVSSEVAKKNLKI